MCPSIEQSTLLTYWTVYLQHLSLCLPVGQEILFPTPSNFSVLLEICLQASGFLTAGNVEINYIL